MLLLLLLLVAVVVHLHTRRQALLSCVWSPAREQLEHRAKGSARRTAANLSSCSNVWWHCSLSYARCLISVSSSACATAPCLAPAIGTCSAYTLGTRSLLLLLVCVAIDVGGVLL